MQQFHRSAWLRSLKRADSRTVVNSNNRCNITSYFWRPVESVPSLCHVPLFLVPSPWHFVLDFAPRRRRLCLRTMPVRVRCLFASLIPSAGAASTKEFQSQRGIQNTDFSRNITCIYNRLQTQAVSDEKFVKCSMGNINNCWLKSVLHISQSGAPRMLYNRVL